MALIERITLPLPEAVTESGSFLPGLRISIRATTASLPDYPQWNPEELAGTTEETLVRDGACS